MFGYFFLYILCLRKRHLPFKMELKESSKFIFVFFGIVFLSLGTFLFDYSKLGLNLDNYKYIVTLDVLNQGKTKITLSKDIWRKTKSKHKLIDGLNLELREYFCSGIKENQKIWGFPAGEISYIQVDKIDLKTGKKRDILLNCQKKHKN